MRGDKLKHGPSTETSQWLGCGVGFTLLGGIESPADVSPGPGGGTAARRFGSTLPTPLAAPILPLYINMSTWIASQDENHDLLDPFPRRESHSAKIPKNAFLPKSCQAPKTTNFFPTR
jgi:hypothetical protein